MNQTQISVNHRQIGYRIKEVREQNHISQAQLAEMTDLSVSYISHIENAKRKASLESIIRIVNALGITIDELLAGVQINHSGLPVGVCVKFRSEEHTSELQSR